MSDLQKNQKKSTHRAGERGNVLFFILIAIVLFGALSFVVGGMMRGGGAETIAEDRAKILASEVMDFGRALKSAMQDMRISNACTDTEIRFVTTQLTGYGTSVRSACDMFDNAGGNIIYTAPQSDVTSDDWLFIGSNIVDDVGTTEPDLIALLPNIPESVCNAVNDASGITAVGTDAAIDFTKFTGSYASTQTIDSASGQSFGCLNYVNSGNNYFFYQVLIKR